MAILEKRRAVNQLPRFQRYQDTRAGDRSAALRGETPITSAIRQLAGSSGYGPMGDSEGFNPMGGGRGGMGGGAGPMGGGMGGGMGGAGKGTVDKFGNVAGQPKTAVTSALKGATAAEKNAIASKAAGTGATAGKVAGTTSKLPGLTSKTTDATGKTITSTGTGAGKTAGVTGAKTLTSPGTGTAKTTGTIGAKTSGSSGSSLSKTLTSALTGAALGAGTKFVIDKLTGKKTGVAGTDKTSGTVKDSGTGLKGNTSNIGSNIGKTITDKVGDTVTKKVNDGITSVVKGDGTTGVAKKVTDGVTKGVTKKVSDTVATKVADKVTSAVKPKSPVTPATKTGTPKAVTPKAVTPKSGAPKAGGAATKTASDIKAENPELTDEEVQAELDRIRDEEESLGVPEGAEDNGDGTYSVTEDGMVTTYDADGNIVSLEAAEDTDGGDDTDDEDDGTTTQVLDDGTVVTLDANGDIVSYTDTDGSVYDADGNEITEGGGDLDAGGNTTETLEDGTQITYDGDGDIVSYTDTDGVVYDGDGNEIVDDSGGGDGSDEEEAYEGLYSDDEGNLYDAEGNFVQYADGTLAGDEDYAEGAVAYTDEYGNTYDYNGDLLEEGDYSDYVQYDEDGNSYNFDGELIDYADGYDPDEGYSSDDEYASDDEYTSDDEYSYEDDYSYDDLDYGKKGGLIRMENGGDVSEEDGEPIEEEENEDGTITQYFDDGSSITYDADGEVYEVTDATEDEEAPALTARGVTVGANNQRYGNVDTAANYQADSRLTGADPTRLQSFLDDIPRTSAITGGDSTPVTSMRDRDQALTDSRPLTPLTNVNINRPAMYTPPEGWPAGFADNFDGTATYVDDDGSTVTIDADSNIVFVTDAYGDVVAQDNEPVTTGGLGQANQNIQYFDDGSYIQTFDDGTSITFDADGNAFRATDSEGNSQLANTTSYDDDGNQTITDYYGNIVKVLDPQGNVIPMGEGRISTAPITNVGSTGAVNTDTESDIKKKIDAANEGRATKSAIDDLLAGLNTYGGAGAAGAVLGALLSDSDLFGGGGGGHSFDMTGVGAIDPRTTDFGIGPANYVGYDQYGTPEQMPELYGRELYQNLNAPGFNEVNPGDYAQYDEEEFGSDDMYLEEPMDEVQPMADGGMPTGGLGQTYPETYYTFGTPVDPLQNLRNPAPYQPQQPQMQPQMPPQAAQNAQQAPMGMQPMGMPQMPQMPQGMPPAGMKRGGLPALSNVPITQGRLNFRQGAAVHGPGDGQSDDIPAMLADGEYVIDAETVAQIGNGSTKAGAQALDKFRENIRMHKRSAPVNKIPPKTKALTSYLKGAR